ncbi:Conserved hypothetical protein [Prochlorococcus marinus str. MIT 9515]|uniref:Uncharacterized protein n=1 Tax=Prochlorococcus marinus (strain MIT 9515) TaxID=167542 RepID=A2BX09_PROM5|nr:hypothetical protein [Prochlorococcus marinus]ABM72320.1 Conserved hypothetical protein [Prochlorococcus marinus str. MIT 9515]
MEDSKQLPEDNNSSESSPDIKKESNKEENVKAFTEFLETASNQESKEVKVNSNLKGGKVEAKKNSLFKRFLNDGFDGISSNPNYKMLALLIILLINLSLFFVIGNLGKAFLRKAGIM